MSIFLKPTRLNLFLNTGDRTLLFIYVFSMQCMYIKQNRAVWQPGKANLSRKQINTSRF